MLCVPLASHAQSAVEQDHAPASCQIAQAEQLFHRQPRPEDAIQPLLTACRDGGSHDYRIALFAGVIQRDHGRWKEAAALLKTAHDSAPQQTAPTLELALTEVWLGHPQTARTLYQQALALEPDSEAAMLGLARVDRAEAHFAEAGAIYAKLLQKNPSDTEALNGKAWVELANKHVAAAQADFSHVLAAQPGNQEARVGLKDAAESWRYQLDLTGGMTHTSAGTAGMGNADLQVSLDARNSVELGDIYNSTELPIQQFTQPSLLPTDDLRLGYFYRVPQGANASFVYDYREHAGRPNEHWASATVGDAFGKGFQWFAGARGAFGAPVWNNLLLQGGLIAPIAGPWQVAVTGYFDKADLGTSPVGQYDYKNNYAFVVDLNHQGPGKLFFNIGTGYSPDLSNVDVHARWVLPVTRAVAFLGTVDHVSINRETQASIGIRIYSH